MQRRILIWAGVGFFVAAFWVIFFFAAGPAANLNRVVMTLAMCTCPIGLASLHFNFPVTYYWAILANAVTYGAIGLMVELTRRQLRHLK